VTLTPFLLAKYEVTRSKWNEVMGLDPTPVEGGTLPARNISWNDCREFCSKTGLSFPTSAQWEYACSEGGEPAPGLGTSERKVRAIELTEPNDFGVHGIKGNVAEWCADSWWPDDFYQESEGATDPKFVDREKEYRVIRSGIRQGSWTDCGKSGIGPSHRASWTGFRPARRLAP